MASNRMDAEVFIMILMMHRNAPCCLTLRICRDIASPILSPAMPTKKAQPVKTAPELKSG